MDTAELCEKRAWGAATGGRTSSPPTPTPYSRQCWPRRPCPCPYLRRGAPGAPAGRAGRAARAGTGGPAAATARAAPAAARPGPGGGSGGGSACWRLAAAGKESREGRPCAVGAVDPRHREPPAWAAPAVLGKGESRGRGVLRRRSPGDGESRGLGVLDGETPAREIPGTGSPQKRGAPGTGRLGAPGVLGVGELCTPGVPRTGSLRKRGTAGNRGFPGGGNPWDRESSETGSLGKGEPRRPRGPPALQDAVAAPCRSQ